MRGDPARTVGELRAHRDVVEYLLISNAGYDRRDIYGDERSGYHVAPRHDIAAAVRRVSAHYGRRRIAATVGAAIGTVGMTTALAGFAAAGVFVVFVAAVCAAWVDRHAPDVMFDAPPDTVTATTSSTDGMTEREVYRRLAIHGERQNLREEKVEKERKKQRLRAESGRRTF